MTYALNVRQLGKCYSVDHARHTGSLREALQNCLRKDAGALSVTHEPYWALRDVSFSLEAGRCLGLLGTNGSGKSTLLKVLAEVVHPTEGRIEVQGRMVSLLEVGTGFHPELTGWENIWLNGALLGLSRAEIAAKLEAIVTFSEVEEFLDTPVKRYSSGMYVKLAFAIAAHVQPDILVVDEVLAVGDGAFQKKCLTHMKRFVGEGGTLLFVSHDYDLYPQLCTDVLWLNKGQVRAYTNDVAGVLADFRSTY